MAGNFTVPFSYNKKMTNYLIYIKIKSFNKNILEKSKLTIFQICSDIGINEVTNLHLPVRRKKITILRSPHIDKKSREQFEWRRHKIVIKTISNTINTAYLLIFLLKDAQFAGVELKISVKFSTFLHY